MITTKTIEYHDGKTVLEGYYAEDTTDTTKSGKKPLVLIAHDWTGRNEFACDKAKKLAELGYIGFALDMFGKGILGKNKEEKSALITPFVQDRSLLQQRITSALQTASNLANVDTQRIAAIGFCFGGLCVLDLARCDAPIKGVVSFHGLLNAPEKQTIKPFKAKVLALHGHDDPMVQPDQVLAFEKEMTTAKADWQVYVYGRTMHGFTNPEANDPGFGTVFNPLTTQRAWTAMRNFFAEIFA